MSYTYIYFSIGIRENLEIYSQATVPREGFRYRVHIQSTNISKRVNFVDVLGHDINTYGYKGREGAIE